MRASRFMLMKCAKFGLTLCLLTSSWALDSESQISDDERLDNPRVNQRIFSKHRILRRHLGAHDARRLLPNDLKLSKHGNHPLLLKKRQPSTNPWSTLYHHQYHPTSPYTQSASPTVASTAYQIYSPVRPAPFHRLSANQMLTVIKTDGPPSVQRTNFKDYYTTGNGTQADDKPSAETDEAAPADKISTINEQELAEITLAYDHLQSMRLSARCRVPRAEVVCVKDTYPSDTKEYVPRCTLLHRCGDKSGCCDKAEHRCSPKAIQEVALNFYAVPIPRPAEANVASSVVKLLFENHTECECVNVANDRSTLSQPQTQSTTVAMTATTTTTTTTTTATARPDEELQKDRRSTEITHQLDHPYCSQCPPPFHIRELGGRCICDCFDKQKPCLKIKRGRLPLEGYWKRCVEQQKCHTPYCEYGTYDESSGRCPERPEGYPKTRKINMKVYEERD